MFAKFRTIFLKIFRICTNLIVCDGLLYWETCPEIWPKSFKKQRSYDNFKHLVKKTANFIFGPLNPKSLDFFGFSKTDLVVHDERNRMAFTASKSALRFSRSQGAGPNRPPHQLTSSRKATSNRVKRPERTPPPPPSGSDTKCLTFPFDAFPPQNAENKRISSLCIDMIRRVCNISKHRL